MALGAGGRISGCQAATDGCISYPCADAWTGPYRLVRRRRGTGDRRPAFRRDDGHDFGARRRGHESRPSPGTATQPGARGGLGDGDHCGCPCRGGTAGPTSHRPAWPDPGDAQGDRVERRHRCRRALDRPGDRRAGQSLNLPVAAEGVEAAEQHRMVLEEGCPQAQGYLFGRPAQSLVGVQPLARALR
ncbi:EAL domain-containing protein [Sphingomonas yabuuchiae]|uniref:EAL domain-containing protein n=1 Tax=Sphingomonas yabuuchiae TaxID=172044 RepID=A0AA40ZYJ1_9SPHN|nr:EAL domain-containing protein [Sphingomonas yabuuchiae]